MKTDERYAAGAMHEQWLDEQEDVRSIIRALAPAPFGGCACASGKPRCDCVPNVEIVEPEPDPYKWPHRIVLAIGIAAGFMAVAGMFGGRL